MSAPNPSLTSSSSAAVDYICPLSSPRAPSLPTITDLNSELSSLSSTQPHLTLLAGGVDESDEEIHDLILIRDLAPVHNILVQLASTLQVKVDIATSELQEVRTMLTSEMKPAVNFLSSLGEIKLPSVFLVSMSSSSMLLPNSPANETIQAIHHYCDQAVYALQTQAEILSSLPRQDIATAIDGLDNSFQQLIDWLDQVDHAAFEPPESIGNELCRDIDMLERDAVLKKIGEFNIVSCSLQFRKPVRSLGHTLDLQEIRNLAMIAKNLIHKVNLQMSNIVNLVLREEIAATTTLDRLAKEKTELLERYWFYLKLKIQQQ